MGIKKYNPTTPGLRGMTVSTFEEITDKHSGEIAYGHSEEAFRKKFKRQDHCQTQRRRLQTEIQDHRFQER
jgi:ribosomal protein L2